MNDFLSAWTTNDTCKASQNRFLSAGAGKIITQWLQMTNINIDINSIVSFIQSHCEKEVTELMKP